MHHILLADDSDDDALLLEEALQSASQGQVQITRYKDGGSALDACLAARAGQYHCIVLDYYLPRRTGAEILTAMVEASVGGIAQHRIIVLASQILPAEQKRLSDLGVWMIADKPVGLDAWLDIAAAMLKP